MLWDGDKVMNFISINITYMWGIYIYKGIGKEIFPSNSHKRLIIQVKRSSTQQTPVYTW